MKSKNTYLVSAPGWPTKYITTASTAKEARLIWKEKTGGPAEAAGVVQVCGKKTKRRGGA